jgi:uncharacterized protein with NRDE domain
MCLIVFAWHVVPGMPLIAAGNRDEFYERPTAPADWWNDYPQVYAGRDLQGGGTWMGITKNGRFAAITNVRNPAEHRDDAPSRGALVANFLTSEIGAKDYIAQISPHAADYNGFNLLVGDHDTLFWYSNRFHEDPRNGKPLASGVYGISNGGLDTCWPKVVRAKAEFSSLLCQCAPEDAFFDMLSDTTRAHDCRLPKTGVSLELERMLSPVCIESPDYGTRASTVVKLDDARHAMLYERAIR